MASKVVSFLKGLLDGARSGSDTTATDLDQKNKDSELVQRKVYGEALYYELEYRRHVKEMQDFELERDQYHRRLQDSAHERNKHLRVSKLPAEILSLIFHCMRLPPPMKNPSSHETFPFRQKTAEWVFVTWVCRHWRNVALNDPTLWTIVPHSWSKWTPQIIERSRNAGLKVDFVGAEDSHENYACMLKHNNRISQLNISHPILAYIISVYGLGSMPKLETLSVARFGHLLVDGRPRRNALLPTNIFNDCENLRYLELSGTHVFLAPNLLPSIIRTSLRHLRLSHCSFPTMADFKPAINTIECLESLLLHHTLSSHTIPSGYGTHAPITLTSLKSLDLNEDPAALIWFLDNFFLTTQCKRTRIATRLSSERSGDRLKLLAAMSRPGAIGQSISAVHSVAFQMSNEPTTALALKANYARQSTSSGDPSADESRDLVISFAPSPSRPFTLDLRRETFHGIFTDIFQHFDWTNLRELSLVSLDFNFSAATFAETLQATFGRLPNIRVIRVGVTAARPLIDTLVNVTDGPRKEILFRGLQEIYLKGASFNYQPGDQGEVEAPHFVNCLRGRLECGVPIQKLDFESCSALTRNHVYAFLGVVPDIVWDGSPVRKGYMPGEDSEDSSESDLDTSEDEDTGEEEDDSESEDSSDVDDDEDDDSNENESDEDDGSDDEETEYSESDSSSLPEYPVFFVQQPTGSQASHMLPGQ